MTDPDEPQHRAYHQPDPSRVTVRDLDGDDGTFAVRMPIASTGEVRNDGDEPLTRDELEGMARQIDERAVSVFLDHGRNSIGGNRYSAIGKVGEWQEAEVAGSDGGADHLEAEARLMDPETLPAATGTVREALAALKSQVERDLSLAASIGWREDEDAPGGNDLMETSIVGIPADPRTTSDGAAAVVARAAVEAGADAEQLVEEVQAEVMGSDNTQMTDEQPASGEEPDDTSEEQDDMDAQEYRESMLEMQQQQTETLSALAEAIQASDEEDDDEEDDDDDDDDEQAADSEDTSEQDAEEPETRTVEIDGEERELEAVAEEYQSALDALRENGITVDDIEQPDAETDDEQETQDSEPTDADPNAYWRAHQ